VSTTSLGAASETGASRLYLADWRRRVSALYEEVRRLAIADPAAAHFQWRRAREALYRSHPSSPVPPAKRAEFNAIYFPYDPSLRFDLPLLSEPEAEASGARPAAEGAAIGGSAGAARLGALALALPVSTGEAPESDRIGWLDVPFATGSRRLAVFWLREYSGGVFLPFRDGTNGHETYGGGRYVLDTAKSADLGGNADAATIVVDFNFAYQPSCAFDPRWSCPLAPPENRLDLEIRAGERIA
jgi:uncharacterized protein